MTSILLAQAVTHVRSSVNAADIPIGSLVLGLEDVASETGILRLPERTAEPMRSNKNAFAAGDILFGRLRPSLRKVAVAPDAGFCTPEMVVLRPIDIDDIWYLWSCLRGPVVSAQVSSLVAGASLPRIAPKDLLAVEVPWPERHLRIAIGIQAQALHRMQLHVLELSALLRRADAALGITPVQEDLASR